MKKVLIPVLAAAAVGMAAPALAQSSVGFSISVGNPGYGYGHRGYHRDYDRGYDRDWVNINQRQAQLDRRIDQGIRNGQITRQEAYRLRAEFRQIAMLEARYRRTGRGLDYRERADLDYRFDRLAQRIRYERRDGDRYRGYGRGW
ncbi:hypothetical protein Q0812_09135 [Brevundimonas sp. 2R-24]|uniref:Uncharacterized protein n=1 Tax=Peiella sedimenti TaxID=3061083 RepID=A0ABT8SM03_9CAUL|nr:hypothetical protein [Caulobacteraceae bacterium XZ-24]